MRLSRRRMLSLGLGSLLLGSHPARAGTAAAIDGLDEVPVKQRKLVKAFLQNTRTPGLVIALYDRGTEATYCVGQARSDRPGAPTPATAFGIGSITKVFTGTFLAHRVLAEPKKYSLDDPVTKHLPWLEGQKVGDIDKVTLEMLATHTSGFPDQGPPGGETLYESEAPDQTLIDWWKGFKLSKAALRAIGTQYAYSNIGMVTLAYAVTGGDYNGVLQRVVARPLGMTSTASGAFLPPNTPLAQGHVYKNGKLVPVEGLNRNLNSSGADMLRFLKAQLGVLAADTPVGRAIAKSHEPQFTIRKKRSMGLAWEVRQGKPTVFTKNGASSRGGITAWIGAAPETQQGLVVLANNMVTRGKYDDESTTRLGTELLAAFTGISVGG